MTGPRHAAGSLPAYLLFGFALSSIGGPLALVSIYAPGALGSALPSAGLVSVLGVLVFAFPLFIWLRYSERIASAGGLYAFVESAAGRRAALVQGCIWALSYFLYLPYTVTYLVYDVLPVVFPGLAPYRPLLEVLLPLALVAAVLARVSALLVALLAGAAVQLALLLVLGALQLAHSGVALDSFTPHAGIWSMGRGAANVSLLFVCGSLPLFLGGEVKGGATTVRACLLASFLVVSPYVVFAAYPLARAPGTITTSEVPGVSIAAAYSGRPLAVVVGIFSAASVGALVVAEFIALSRLLHGMLGRPVRETLAGIAVPFVLADVVSLVDPQRFYDDLLTPSLAALFLSQLIVFAVYPRFARRLCGRLRPLDIVVATAAAGLMLYALSTVVTTQLGAGS